MNDGSNNTGSQQSQAGGRPKPSKADLERRFNHHPPHGDQTQRYGAVRASIRQAAAECVDLTPVCPEQTRALNALDDAMFLFNAAIARTEAKVIGTGDTTTLKA